MNYTDLEIWKISHKLVLDIHKMTKEELPKFEMYEVGSQIRRASKSIKSNIVEGYGKKGYKKEFLRFLYISKGSLYETEDHLITLYETQSLKNEKLYSSLKAQITELKNKLNAFINSVQKRHNQLKNDSR